MGAQKKKKKKEGSRKWETQDTTTRRVKSRRRENKVETDRTATSGSDVVGSPHGSPTTTQLSLFFFFSRALFLVFPRQRCGNSGRHTTTVSGLG